ncbi:MAG: hypothetical protein M3352_10520 [Bacteroidota bacterium]|nr:hypothetical protein [Bacteroidota bacterium]
MKKLLLFPILFIVIAVHAQTISNYLSPPYPTNLTSSKSGSTIAWVFNDKGSRNVYTAGADGNNVTRITNYSGDDGMEIADVQITSGGEQIVYVRGNAPNSRGETANPAFLQTPTERVIYITDKNDTTQRISSGASPRISPDGKLLAYYGKPGMACITGRYFCETLQAVPIPWQPKQHCMVTRRKSNCFCKQSRRSFFYWPLPCR